MPTFMFWNLQKKPLLPRVERLVRAYAVDVIILAEADRLGAGAWALAGYHPVGAPRSRLDVFDRTASEWEVVVSDPLRGWAGFRVRPSVDPPFNLFVAHLPSKLHASSDDQRLATAELAADISEAEARSDERTLVVGDLNVNPFEAAVVGASGLHAVSCREVARRERRMIRGREYRLFYNPMWGVLGDRTPGPPGTYYRAAGGAVNYYWNVYDQVLLRPALMDSLGFLRVLTEDGDERLTTVTGLPGGENASDHLPILFRLDW